MRLLVFVFLALAGVGFGGEVALVPLPAEARWSGKERAAGARVEVAEDKSVKHPEGYRLVIPEEGAARIFASGEAGVFYAKQTLRQVEAQAVDGRIPCGEIVDEPRFGWRGLMLDEARHFMGREYVLRLLDVMAAHKMNRFHWHLTDDQGWRIEIKGYPELTEVGAWRGKGTKLRTPKFDKAGKEDPDGPRYGGFYTREEIREIVAYAKARHIEILPEIDVPGHARAILAAYPEMAPKSDGKAGASVQGVEGNVLSVAREENYRMLDGIFGEIAELFPFPYLHVGGDEVNMNAWKASPEHRAMMKEKGFQEPGQLQNHFMLCLEKILKGHGKTLLGWNEIMHGGHLSKETGVMAWISVKAGLHAARAGHPTVMAVGPHAYFDMKYPGPGETGHWWAGIVSTRRAYEWNPVFAGKLTPEEQARVMGVQCCLWTEFVPDPADADYKLWPRACATAEVGWTPQERRKWEDFDRRLGRHLAFLDGLKVGYRVRPPSGERARGKVTIRPPHEGAKVAYTLDGSDPDGGAEVYAGEEFPASVLGKLRYRTVRPDGRMSKVARGAGSAREKWLDPGGAVVKTEVPHHGGHEAKGFADWDRKTFFWTNRKGKKGDEWTVVFKEPVELRELSVPTGKPASNDDIIVDGTLEVSEDGKAFREVGRFEYGTATALFEKPAKVKALRVRLNSDHRTWIILRDPEMK